jgi:hypothetical protein
MNISWPLITPVVFCIYRRPDCTVRVFEAIREARPRNLIVVADGWRTEEDRSRCNAARAATERIDWDCNVERLYSDTNLGCERRMSSGITAVFERYERAIIVEDDCLPTRDFFRFCGEMLTKYHDDERVLAVNGTTVIPYLGRKRAAYGFSRYMFPWGWATWRRAWKLYDFGLSKWPELSQTSWLYSVLRDPSAVRYWRSIFDKVARGEINSWAYRWIYSSWLYHGLTVAPSVNMVSNIGFGPDATHTFDASSNAHALPTGKLPDPIKPALRVRWSRLQDARAFRVAYVAQFRRVTPLQEVRLWLGDLKRQAYARLR